MNDIITSSYDYDLPDELIASYPANPKENAKLLVYDRKNDTIKHLHFYDLNDVLPECDIVFNDTKVIKARIYGQKQSGGKVELFINKTLAHNEFMVQIKGRVKKGDFLYFENDIKALVKDLFDDGSRLVEFYKDDVLLQTNEIYTLLDVIGHIPLPPYIKRDDEKSDEDDYQSVFAKNLGAVAAPTASLHFSKDMIENLKKNHNLHQITLHVGAGTFKGVEVTNINDHKMHSEFYDIPKHTQELILSDKKILGIGTTTARTIEYFARTKTPCGECDLFLHPQNRPIRLDYLLTNFHLPKSTLIMLVASFIGRQKTIDIYKEAIKNNYKFYSYGDGMLII